MIMFFLLCGGLEQATRGNYPSTAARLMVPVT
jgi:hypothetical protein